jgi:hypothetical protein
MEESAGTVEEPGGNGSQAIKKGTLPLSVPRACDLPQNISMRPVEQESPMAREYDAAATKRLTAM